jgi:predicted AAA+ superfamily ATPase
MPHFRPRYLDAILKKALAGSPILSIVGQRQTGKSTIVERVSKEYVTLDDEEQLELALKEPKTFIGGHGSPFGIDECQHGPGLFPALKEFVRKSPRPGQFLLTGSVRFTAVEDIKESLTGRTIDLELLPLSLTETNELPLLDIRKLSTAAHPIHFLQRQPFADPKCRHALIEFLAKGGLPGLCFVRSETLRVRKMRSHLKSILDRDLRLVTKTNLDYLSLKTFLEEIALQQGMPFDLTAAAKGARIAVNSARKILSGLEAVFLVRVLRKDGDTAGKAVFLEDQGLASFLLAERGQSLARGSLRVSDWVRLLFQQVFAQTKYRDDLHSEVFAFRTRGGAIMDLCVRIDRELLGYSVGMGSQASPSQIRGAEQFRKRFKEAKVFLLHQGPSFRELAKGVYEAPFGAVL